MSHESIRPVPNGTAAQARGDSRLAQGEGEGIVKRELQPWRPAAAPSWRSPGAAAGDHFSQARLLRVQLHRYLQALRRRGWVVVVTLVLIGGPALMYAWHKPASFQAQAFMWLNRLKLPHDWESAEELTSYVGTQAQILKSPPLLARALAQVRRRFPSLRVVQAKGAALDSPFELSVRSSQHSTLLELKATGPEAEATRAFLDAVMDEYLAFKQESRLEVTTGALSGLTEQVRQVERHLQDQQQQLQAYESSNNMPFMTEQVASAGRQLAQLSATLSDRRTERQFLELLTPKEYKGLGENGPASPAGRTLPGERLWRAPTPEGAASQGYYAALQQLQLLKAQRDEFATVLRPAHSKMVKLNQQIHGLEQALNRLQAESEEQARVAMEDRKKSLELELQNLESQYRTWETNATEASHRVSEHKRLEQEVQRSQALYERLVGLLHNVDTTKLMDEGGLQKLAPASAARPTWSRYGIGAAGLFLALLVGVGVFMFLEFLDDRFTSAVELSLQLPTEVVGQIPRTRLSLPDGASHLLPLTTAQPAFAESFRNLRSSLLFMSGQERPPKVILITSAIPKEGKTTVASNLAGILALSGARVLLVDADFRRGYLHRIFRVRRKPGLLEVLSEEVPPAQAIVASGQANLFLLPAGETGDYTSDVLLRYRVDQWLQALAKNYDHVVIDSAPVLATDDAACLGPYTDGAYLVVRAAYTSSRMTQEAWERLTRRKVKVLGVIYNCAPASSDYYSHYSREYGTARSSEFVPTSAAVEQGNGQVAGQD